MKVVIRTDSSINIGSGHLMRCLTLADNLAKKDADITFICRNLEGNLSHLVESKGYKLVLLKTPSESNCVINPSNEYEEWLAVTQDYEIKDVIKILSITDDKIDWLIVDHYSLDEKWETSMRPFVDNIMVIDDLANRKHDCDILLDYNLYNRLNTRYNGLVSENCLKLLGPKFVLLRDEFKFRRETLNNRNGDLDRIFVFFGGSDLTGETIKTLQVIIRNEFTNITFDIVVGALNSRKDEIESICINHENINFHFQINNIAELMFQSHLAIGGGGTTTYERYCLGLPTVVIAIAENQVEAAEASHKLGLSYYLGECNAVTKEHIYDTLILFKNNPDKLIELERNSLGFVDGQGVNKVTQFLETKAM